MVDTIKLILYLAGCFCLGALIGGAAGEWLMEWLDKELNQ